MLKDNKYIRFNNNNNEGKNIKDQWRNIKNNIYNAVEEILGYRKKVPRKDWMTSEILDMIEKRRLAKRNITIYIEIHCKIRAAKNTWLIRQCKEAEKLHAKYDAFHFH
jgi:hypothetical protein